MEKDKTIFWRLIKNYHYRVKYAQEPCGHCELSPDCPFEDCGRYTGMYGYFTKDKSRSKQKNET